MKAFLFFSVVFFSFTTHAQTSYSDSLKTVRKDHDSTFLATVLVAAERKNMVSLCYFQPDRKYIVKAKFESVREKKFAMPMTKDTRPMYYRKFGKLTFTLDGKECVLFVYENLELKDKAGLEDYLFLPFRDLTSGKASYGGGRFIDLKKSNAKEWVIDFNTAYNPYCAYSPRYACPVTPSENKIYVEIKAGACLEDHD